MTDADLTRLESEFGGYIRRAMAGGLEMADDYPSRLDARMNARAARRVHRAPMLSRRTLVQGLLVASVAALMLGAGVLSQDEVSADARTLVSKVLAANDPARLTLVPRGVVRHMTVVTSTIGAASTSLVLEEWFGDEGRSVRAELPSGEILMLGGGEGWMYTPAERVARRVDLAAKGFHALGLGRFGLDAAALASDARIAEHLVVLGRPATRVEFASTPIADSAKGAGMRTRREIVVDDATFEIRESRTTTLDASGAVISEVVTTVTRDELIDEGRVPAGFFRFTPPPGTRIVD